MVVLISAYSSFLYVVRNKHFYQHAKKLRPVRDGPGSYGKKTLTRTQSLIGAIMIESLKAKRDAAVVAALSLYDQPLYDQPSSYVI